MRPDLIVAQTPPVVVAVLKETSVVPIVFVDVSDPVGAGFIANLARPGGNITGLMAFEAGIVGKWLAMLKEIDPYLDALHWSTIRERRCSPISKARPRRLRRH